MKIKKRKVWIRLTAAILVVTMVVGYCASALIDIKISEDASNAAMNYLASNTEYVKQSRSERFLSLVKSMKKTRSLEDYYLEASMRIGAAKYEEALPYIDKCLEFCSPSRYKEVYVDVLTKKGCLLALLGRSEEAVEVLNLAVETTPEMTDAYLVLAQIYLENDDADKLEETLGTYLGYVPEDLDIRVNYMQTLGSQNKEKEARDQADIILTDKQSNDENRDDAYHVLAILDFGREDFESALANLENIQDTGERFQDIFYDKGVCYMSLGDMDKATESFSASIDLGYNKQASLYSRGACEFSKTDNPDYQSAVDDIVAAYEYSEEDRDEDTAAMAEELLRAIIDTAQ